MFRVGRLIEPEAEAETEARKVVVSLDINEKN